MGPTAAVAQRIFRGAEPFLLEDAGGALHVDDFDRDGRQDVAVAHEGSARVSVLLADGEGGFDMPAVYEVGLSPVSLRSGDLDQDGFPDLVVANSGSSSVSILLSEGDGSFGVARDSPVGVGPRVVGLGHFNGDRAIDVVTTNLVSRELFLLFGDGAGAFPASERLSVGDNPHSMVVADFDRDDLADVAVAHTEAVSIFYGRGDEGLERLLTLHLPISPQVIACGNLDQDALPDLAMITDDDTLLVFLNVDGLSFRESSDGRILDSPWCRNTTCLLDMVDFDGDGFQDIVTQFSRFGDFGIRVHAGAGDGIFAPPADVVLGSRMGGLAFDDFDGDGALDAVATRSELPELALFRGEGPGRLATRTVVPLDAAPRDLALFGRGPEAPGLIAISSSAVHYFAEGIEGDAPVAATVAPFPGRSFQGVLAAELGGGGDPELAITDLASPGLLVLSLDGSGRIIGEVEHRLGGLPTRPIAGDFDGDGILDVAVANQASPSLSVVFTPGVSGAEVLRVPVGSSQTALTAGDIDGDGRADLVVAGARALLVFLGATRTAFARGPEFEGPDQVTDLALADFDGDEALDLAVASRDGTCEILYGFGSGTPVKREQVALSDPLVLLEVADLNGDRSPDLVGASTRSLEVALGLPGGSFAPPERYLVGLAPRAVVFFERASDGRIDAVTADFGSRGLSILHGAPGREEESAFVRGDADLSGRVNITDAVVVFGWLFLGGDPISCPDAADVNDDGRVEITDAVNLLMYLFLDGPAPAAPYPAKGRDVTEDGLECRMN